MVPNLKLVINPEADIKNCIRFIKESEFVDWFLPLDFQYILSKKFSSLERGKIIREYTRYRYKINEAKIKQGINATKKRWRKAENKFYKIINEIFQGHPWQKGKYLGIASIYFMYPRDIGAKTFYFPWVKIKADPLRVIGHEMIHFIFFDYIKKKYGLNENSKIKSKDPKYVWQVSETFNNVMENWKPYKNIFRENDSKPYPGCEKMYQLMKQQWNKKQDISELLDKGLLK